MARHRRLLLFLYVFAALADTAAKTLATSETFDRAVARALPGGLGDIATTARRPGGNFEIFRAASRRLLEGRDLYAPDPGTLQDRFKYSPTFALLFAPLAWLPWSVALMLWSLLNALVLFAAIDRLLPGRRATLALWCLFPEVVRSMQNAQSNALVAALVVFAFLALERERPWRAAAATMLGACIKLFPLVAFTFAIPRREVRRVAVAGIVLGVVMLLLPLLVTRPATLLAQYASWGATEAVDAHERWFSVMALLHQWLGMQWPNWPVQVAGAAALLAPIGVRRDRWTNETFRTLFLCSALLWVTLFNHQAERSSYLIAFTGATIWFTMETRTRMQTALYAIALLTIPLMSTVIPLPAALRTPTVMLYRLAVPSLVIWLVIQFQLLRAPVAASARLSAVAA